MERSPALRTGGYKIDVRGIAVTAARRAGILDEVCWQASDVRGASFVDSSGRRLADLDADFVQGRKGDDLEIMRGSLSGIRPCDNTSRGATSRASSAGFQNPVFSTYVRSRSLIMAAAISATKGATLPR